MMRPEVEFYDIDGNPVTIDEAERLLCDREARRIASTDVGWLWVSTVHLVLDHAWGDGPPLIFETMVFPALGWSMLEEYCERTPTKQAALAAHDQAVEWAKANQALTHDNERADGELS